MQPPGAWRELLIQNQGSLGWPPGSTTTSSPVGISLTTLQLQFPNGISALSQGSLRTKAAHSAYLPSADTGQAPGIQALYYRTIGLHTDDAQEQAKLITRTEMGTVDASGVQGLAGKGPPGKLPGGGIILHLDLGDLHRCRDMSK